MPDTSFWHFNGDFIIDYKPEVTNQNPQPFLPWDEMRDTITYLPGFMFHKDLNHKLEEYKFLLPDPYVGRGHPRAYAKTYQEVIDRVDEGVLEYEDWDDKEDKAFWVGQCTGSRIVTKEFINEFNQEHWDYLVEKIKTNQTVGHLYPRVELFMQSNSHPDLLKIQFNFNKFNCHGLFDVFNELGISALDYATFPIAYDTHLKYKYLISIDGNGAAWLRIPWIMHSNSLLIKQDSTKV